MAARHTKQASTQPSTSRWYARFSGSSTRPSAACGRGGWRVLFRLYAAAMLALFCCYSAAILLLSCCYPAAILLLFCCCPAAILALFQLYSFMPFFMRRFIPCFMPGSKPPPPAQQHNQQQQQNPNDPKQRQRNQGNTDRQADREGGGGARSPARPPLVFLCLLGGSGGAGWPSQHSRSVGPPTVAARSPATRAPLDRRAEPVHAARNARADARECGSCSRPPRRRSHSLTASRLARFDRHHHPSSQVPCRDTRAHSFAGRHFELVRRGSRGAAAPHHRLRNLTVASEIHDEIAVSRSGNCRLLCGAGAILRYSGCCYSCAMLRYSALFLRYSCVILALFLRYSCVILALFRCYSGFIPLVIPSAPPPSAHEPRRGRRRACSAARAPRTTPTTRRTEPMATRVAPPRPGGEPALGAGLTPPALEFYLGAVVVVADLRTSPPCVAPSR